MKRIPIRAVKGFAKTHGLNRIIIFASEEYPSKTCHICTWGKTLEQCEQAADFGNQLKLHMGWPIGLMTMPARVCKLSAEIKELKKENRRLMASFLI